MHNRGSPGETLATLSLEMAAVEGPTPDLFPARARIPGNWTIFRRVLSTGFDRASRLEINIYHIVTDFSWEVSRAARPTRGLFDSG